MVYCTAYMCWDTHVLVNKLTTRKEEIYKTIERGINYDIWKWYYVGRYCNMYVMQHSNSTHTLIRVQKKIPYRLIWNVEEIYLLLCMYRYMGVYYERIYESLIENHILRFDTVWGSGLDEFFFFNSWLSRNLFFFDMLIY